MANAPGLTFPQLKSFSRCLLLCMAGKPRKSSLTLMFEGGLVGPH